MNPEDVRTGNYLAKICGEITRNYDVDGIHLDYIRYPENWNIKVSRDKGRQYITSIVQKIHDAVKQAKPWVKMSCSPIGKYDDLTRYWSHGWNANTKVCQDAQGWLKSGLMDELFPMMYFRNEQFFPFANDWAEQSDGKIVVPGLAIYFLDPKEGKWKIGDVTSEMCHLRNLGLGYAFFRNKFFLDNKQGIYDFTVKEFNHYLSLVPPMTWVSDKKLQSPASFQVSRNGGEVVLTWKNRSSYEDGTPVVTPYIYNNVYASRSYPVDVTDARNLISARKMENGLALEGLDDEQPLCFAVTSMDGYGNESTPTQENPTFDGMKRGVFGKARWLKCDGRSVKLPSEVKNVDATCFLFETLQGEVVKSAFMKGNMLSVSGLSEGVYVVKSLNKRGVSHSLGTFIYKKFQKK